jgi:hypothetical protein
MGRRYLTLVWWFGEVTRLFVAEPFGQGRPREIGLSGSPSISVTRSSFTNTSCPQATAQ